MFTKIDLEFIALFQRIVVFVDHFFCITRKTLILIFILANAIYACVYFVSLINATLSLISYTDGTVIILIFYFSGLFLLLFLNHFSCSVLGFLCRDLASDFSVNTLRGCRISLLIAFLSCCFAALCFKYLEATKNGNFEGFTFFGYVMLFGIFCSIALMYLVCTKTPPPLENRSEVAA